MQYLWKTALILTALGAIEGCATSPLVGGPNTFCKIAEPITWSSRDTAETVIGVRSHNAVGKELCGWRGSK